MGKKQGTKRDTPAKAASAAIAKGKKAKGKTETETIATVEAFMADMYNAGTKTVPESEVLKSTGYARNDSTGYRKAMKTLLKVIKTVEKSSGNFILTEAGVKKLKDSGAITPEPTTNEENKQQLKEKLHKMAAKAPTDKIDAVWDIVMDGEVHTKEELLAATGYTRSDSTGFREIMKWLNKLEIIRKAGNKSSFELNKEKVFPFPE